MQIFSIFQLLPPIPPTFNTEKYTYLHRGLHCHGRDSWPEKIWEADQRSLAIHVWIACFGMLTVLLYYYLTYYKMQFVNRPTSPWLWVPWGTPHLDVNAWDLQEPSWTICDLSFRKESSHWRALECRSNSCNVSISSLWETVSKAADRSCRIRAVALPWSTADLISSSMANNVDYYWTENLSVRGPNMTLRTL